MIEKSPLNEMFNVSLTSLKNILDVNTIIGETIKLDDDIKLIPISKVKMSFASGGTERKKQKQSDTSNPYGGGIGSSLNINPVCFILVNKGNVSLLKLDSNDKDVLNTVIKNFSNLISKDEENIIE